MKRISMLLAVAWVTCILASPIASAQSEKQGIATFNEAQELWNKRSSKEDKEKALARYQEALAVFQRVKSDKWEGVTLSRISLVYQSLSQYQKALEYGEKALVILRKVGNAQMEATTLSNSGLVYERLGQYQKALEYGDKALAIHRKVGNAQMEATTLSNNGLVYERLGQYQKALECLEHALPIQTKIPDLRGEGFTLHRMGLVHQVLGQYQKALEYYAKALDTRKKAGDEDGQGTTLETIGEVYLSLGQYQKALECLEKALGIFGKLGNLQMEGTTLNSVGAAYSSMGQYQKALANHEKALSICQRIGDAKFEAWSWSLIGRVYQSSGQRRKALENYEKALEIRRKIGDVRGEGTTLSDIGTLYMQMGKDTDALSAFQKGLEVYGKIGVPTNWPKHLIGNFYLDRNELDKAEPFVKEAGYDSSLGRLYLLKADLNQARQHYDSLLAKALKTGNVDNLFTAYTGLGKVYEALEDYKKAEECYEKGMKLTEEIRSGLLPAERKDFFEVKINGFSRSEPAKGLTRVRMKLNQAAKSIDSSEVTRARAFADNIAMRSDTGYAGIPTDVLEQEDALVGKVAALKKELGKTDKEKSPEKYENLSKEMLGAEAELNVFVHMLWEKHKAYASVKYPRPVTLQESALRPEECVVMFDVSDEGVGVKLIKGKKISETYYKEWKSADLERDVTKFRQSFEQAKLSDFDPELGASLYIRLLSRVLAEVPKGTPLIIIPDGILAVLPFEALVVSGTATWKQDGSGPYPEGLTYLGDAYPISYYQSITSMTLARTLGSKDKKGEKTLVLADPVFQADDTRLKGASGVTTLNLLSVLPKKLMSIKEQTGMSLERLSLTADLGESLKKLDPSQTDLYLGVQARKSVLFQKPLTDYGAIVLATHGYFGNDFPGIREPVIIMSLVEQPEDQDGFLRMTEVMGMKLNADVVALTACQTGLGNNLAGEGVMSMGKAFQFAGAKSTLMSLWSVSESGSVLLVEKFFQHRKAGKNKLEALKSAREDVRKDGYHHPFYWASFILLGEVN